MKAKKYQSLYKLFFPLLSLLAATVILSFTYYNDNKYTAGPPYGSSGIFEFSPEDLDNPMFLIDGWEFFPDQLLTPADPVSTQRTTYIGQYSNFSQLQPGHSPFGSASYRLTLRSDGPAAVLTLSLPEIFTDYTLWAGDQVIASSGQEQIVSFVMDQEITLLLSVSNNTHYYSGLIYPPTLGTPEIISRIEHCRLLFYGILTIFSVTLALFSAVLWMSDRKEDMFLHYGILCLAFALSCAYPLFPQTGYRGLWWYGLENSARMLFFAEAAASAAIAAGLSASRWYTKVIRPLTLFTVFTTFIIVVFIIPSAPFFVNIFGYFTEICYIFLWLCLVLSSGAGIQHSKPLSTICLCGSMALSTSILANLFDNSDYEPIRTGWQSEYTGFLLVLLFAGMMIWRNHLILKENRELTGHLEELAARKTEQLELVLEERKNFFSDMAHSLKSPVAAIHGFINLIRENNVCTDEELIGYLQCIDRKNLEMSHRIQALNTLNAFDRIHTPRTYLSLMDILKQVRHAYDPEAVAAGIFLVLNLPPDDCTIYAQEEKLWLLFENLIYNALSFTPLGGSITISGSIKDSDAVITIEDTGIGIAPEHLPHIFERFYTVRNNPSEGSGLGLYISRLTVEELGGTITADSVPNKGSIFTIRIPASVKK